MSNDLPRLTASPSIYEFLSAKADETGRLPEDVRLPDEAPSAPGTVVWAAGALEGVFGHRVDSGNVEADRLAELLTRAADKPSRRRLRRLMAGITHSMVEVVDATMARLVELEARRDGIHRVGHWLAATATEREHVKLGVALLGLTGVGDAAGLLRTLGAHDEFTLYAAVAFANDPEDDGESEIWALATLVDGWGRIQCVERLRSTSDPAIRRWILRTGFRNSVMYEYLAYIAATTGGLLEALRGSDVDRELLDAACEIIEALVMGGPAEDLDDWEDGADAIEAYLSVLTTRAESIRDYRGVAAVRDFLAREDGWGERSARGWTATRRSAFEGVCAKILGLPAWRELATTALASPDRVQSWLGDQVLRDLGVSTFEHHFAAVRADPHEGSWFDAWQQADGDGAKRLVQLARDTLPLDDIASGASREVGVGPGWADHFALDWTLQGLRDYPGVGGDLLMVGLRSPTVRNRNISLQALGHWPAHAWPDGARTLLTAMAGGDPDEQVRDRAQQLLGSEAVS